MYTLQLKAFIQRKSFNPVLDNSYSAKAGQKLEDILDSSISNDIMAFIYAYHCFVFVLIILLVISMLYVGNYHKLWLNKIKKIVEHNIDWQQKEALLLSITVISVLFTMYIIILDILALNKYIRNMNNQQLNGKLFHVPAAVFACDSLFAVLSAIFLLILFCSCYSCCCSCEHNNCCMCYSFKLRDYVLEVLIIVCQIVIFVTHVPFITIAYLNDAYHAGSIFIFYIVSILLILSIIEISYYTFKRMIPINVKEGIKLKCEKTTLEILQSDEETSDSVIVQEPAIIKFKKSVRNEMTADIILQDRKVVKGQLKDLKIELESPDKTIIERFMALEGAKMLRLACTLILNDKKEIQTEGECTVNNCEFLLEDNETKGIIHIKECELHNETGFFLTLKDIYTTKKIVLIQTICIIASMITLCVLTLSGIVLTAAYLVLIPINRSISDAPNRLIGVYNTVFLIIGVYIAYKAFFKKKISLKSVIENSKETLTYNKNDEEWSSLSKEEKLAEFYRTQAEVTKFQAEKYCSTQD